MARFYIVEAIGVLCAAVTLAFAVISAWLVIDGKVAPSIIPIFIAMAITAWRGARCIKPADDGKEGAG